MGVSGYSGHSGISGYSGPAGGATGSSGYSGYSGPSGFSGYSGPSGFSGISGDTGLQGPQGIFGGDSQPYYFRTATSGDPGSGGLLLNNATISSATTLTLNQYNSDLVVITAWQAAITSITYNPKGVIRIFKINDSSTFADFYIVPGLVVVLPGNQGYQVTYITGNGTFSDFDLVAISWTRAGNTGTSGFSGYSGGGIGNSGFSGYSGATGTGTSGFSGYSGNSTSGFSGFSGTDGSAGSTGTSGFSGYSGKSGFSGYSGMFGGDTHSFTQDQGTIVPGEATPATGQIMTNAAPFGSATELDISVTNGDGATITNWLLALDDSTNSSARGFLRVVAKGDSSKFTDYRITGAVTNNTTWVLVPVAVVVSNSTIGPSVPVLLTFARAGDSGFSGYSGQSGFSGYSGAGTSGFSGYSGISGFSGYSGPNGSAGDSGFSGYSGTGTSGFSGYSGAAGSTGSAGSTGTSGFSGYSGSAGSVGTSGFSGYSGTNGSVGPSGFSGYSGISGFSGYSGISGFSGYSGISGFSGYSGRSGFSGYSGRSGFSGYSGPSGFSGYSGISGFSGYSGISGFSGYSGISGFSGYSGRSGYSGYSGGAPGGSNTQVQFNDSSVLAGDADLTWDKTNNILNVAQSTASTKGTMTINASNTLPALLLTGGSADATSDSTGGVALYMTHNGSGNRQFVIGASDNYNSSSASVFRYLTGSSIATVDGITGNGGTRCPINLGTDTSSIAVGNNALAYNASLPGKISVYQQASQPGIYITGVDTATYPCITLDNTTGTNAAPFIKFSGDSAADRTKNVSTDTTLTDWALAGGIKINVNGVEYWIQIHSAAINP